MHKKIAIPVDKGTISAHFGHCEQFAILEVRDGKIISKEFIEPPEHRPGLYPEWIAGFGVSDVIASGMGQQATALFNKHHINVFLGAPLKEPEIITEDFLRGDLSLSANPCNHDALHNCHSKQIHP